MAERRCAACGRWFEPRCNVPQQRYCSRPECQRSRRRRWQREKLAADADYRANQAAAQRRWSKHYPEYWRRYRERHPDYRERDRVNPSCLLYFASANKKGAPTAIRIAASLLGKWR